MEQNNSLLNVKDLVKHFDISGGLLDQLALESRRVVRKKTTVKAVNAVSFAIMPQETLGVVGESGCGKSTLARAVLGLYPPNSGEIHYQDQRIDNLNTRQMLPFRKKMQMIFQDPYASLNPRMTVKKILEEPVYFHNKSISAQAAKDKVARSAPSTRSFRSSRNGRSVAGPSSHRGDAAGWGGSRLGRALSARIFRRPETTDQHCARPDGRS